MAGSDSHVASAKQKLSRGHPGGVQFEWHRAVFEGDLKKLSEIKAWPENRWYDVDGRGLTMLHIAALRGSTDIIRKLLDAGCPLWVRDANGWTALDYGMSTEQEEVCTVLKAYASAEAVMYKEETKIEDCRLRFELSTGVDDMNEIIFLYKLKDCVRIDFRRRAVWIAQLLGIPYLDGGLSQLVSRLEDPSPGGNDILSLLATPDQNLHLIDRARKRVVWEQTAMSAPRRRCISLIDKRFFQIEKNMKRPRAFNGKSKATKKKMQHFEARIHLNSKGMNVRTLSHKGRLHCTWSQYRAGYREKKKASLPEASTKELSKTSAATLLLQSNKTPLGSSLPQQLENDQYYFRPTVRDLKMRLTTGPPRSAFLTSNRLLALLDLIINPVDRRSPLNKLRLFIDQYLARNEIDGAPISSIEIDSPPPLDLSFRLALQEVQILDSLSNQRAPQSYALATSSKSTPKTTSRNSVLEIVNSSSGSHTESSKMPNQNQSPTTEHTAKSQACRQPETIESKCKATSGQHCFSKGFSSIFRRRKCISHSGATITTTTALSSSTDSTVDTSKKAPTPPVLDPISSCRSSQLVPLVKVTPADFLIPAGFTPLCRDTSSTGSSAVSS